MRHIDASVLPDIFRAAGCVFMRAQVEPHTLFRRS